MTRVGGSARGNAALVVVGASLAGLRAVESARRTGYTGRIVLVGAERHLPYDRPPLSKAFLRSADESVTTFRGEPELREELGVELMLGTPAEGLDIDAREIFVVGQRIGYSSLIIATGARPRRLPGTDGIAGVHELRTVDDALAIRQALSAGARTVVIGAGFIGSEIASAAHSVGAPVTVVEAQQVPLAAAIGAEAGALCGRLHDDACVDLRLGVGVTGVRSTGGTVTGVELADGEVLDADLVVVGIGVTPATDWLVDSGISLHPKDNGVLCDATLATSAAGVYAAGDVAHVPNPLFDGDVMRLEHWTNAAEQGAAAARHALDPSAALASASRPSVPYFWSDVYGHRIQFVGTARADEVITTDDTAVYRRGDRVVGALTIDRPRDIMKYRRKIAGREHISEALEFAKADVG